MNSFIEMFSKLQGKTANIDISPEAVEGSRLRTALAVRGWVDPRHLFTPGLSAEAKARVLEAVAPDVETDWRSHPREWYLRDAVRRSVLVTRSSDELREALDINRLSGDAADPVRVALQARRSPLPPTLDGYDTDVLSALMSSLTWLAPAANPAGHAHPGFWHTENNQQDTRERLRAIIARRRRQQDVERMTRGALHGRSSALRRLVRLASQPPPVGAAGYYAYMSGIGGAGKSTLFAHLERTLEGFPVPPLLVYLDCDQPGFDPTDIVALDIALFRQLSVVLPERAADLRNSIANLAAAARTSDLGYAERTSSAYSAEGSAPVRKSAPPTAVAKHAVASYASLERAVAERHSARQSISWDALKDASGSKPLVLLIDTAELIFARGQDAVQIVLAWIASLGPTLGVLDRRVIVAGRGPAESPGPQAFAHFLSRPAAGLPWIVVEPILLDDLDEHDAAAMLTELGINDTALAASAAAVLPRTPLLLRIAADVYNAGENDREAFVQAISGGKVEPGIAVRYLTERVIRHTATISARPYVLAAVVLPEITRRLLAEVVIPVVDADAKLSGSQANPAVGEIFDGLAAAGWLVREGGEPSRITFHPEIRRLVLILMEAEPDSRLLVRKIRIAALEYYRLRRTPADRTFFAYFAALLCIPLPSTHAVRLKPEVLGTAIEDLSEESRARLFDSDGAEIPLPTSGTYADVESKTEWRQRLEGSASRDGEGERLVKRSRAAEALALYRRRPTRPTGMPPTFVIQALADNAEWDTGDVDVEQIVEELRLEVNRISSAVPNALRSRVYWLTRYALLSAPGPLSKAHSDLLVEVTGRITGRGPVLLFPGLVALAESFSADRGQLAPDAWFDVKGAIESETRMFLVHYLYFRREATWRPHLDALVVTQPDWINCFLTLLARMDARLEARSGPSRLGRRVQTALTQLSRSPASPPDRIWVSNLKEVLEDFAEALNSGFDLPKFNVLLRQLRLPIVVSVDAETHSDDAIFLLRGLTTEIHRPLRAAIGRLAADSVEWDRLEKIARRCVDGFGFKPRELTGPEFDERLSRDPAGVFTILIPFADRSRRLPDLCNSLANIEGSSPEVAAVIRVAQAFLNWDTALCHGGSSIWRQAG
jgi:hypothetical protein